MKTAILICARLDSKRLPMKALLPLAGKPALQVLIERLKQSRYQIILCTTNQNSELPLVYLAEKCGIEVFQGEKDNVLKRMVDCARKHKLDCIVRVTADDLFIDVPLMEMMIEDHLKNKADYTYVSNVPEGIATEIISAKLLDKTLQTIKLDNTEFVSYYVRKYAKNINKFIPPDIYQYPCRLTLDYPEDHIVLEILSENLSARFGIWELVNYLKQHPYILEINRLPKVSIYIANYNYGQWLDRAVNSVLKQTFIDYELIIIDDCSTDNSLEVMMKYSLNPKIKLMRNETNLRLATTSNRALEIAKGEYIIRLDADDEFMEISLGKMVDYLDKNENIAIVYPNYYFEVNGRSIVKRGREKHHPAGAMIRKKCWNEIKFNNNRNCLDGLDFYIHFSKRFEIGYINEPLFIYHQHPDNLSKDIRMMTSENNAIEKELLRCRS